MSNNWTVCVDLHTPETVADVTCEHPVLKQLSDQRIEADSILESEKKSSYDQGYTNGLAQGRAELHKKIEEFQTIELQFLKQVSGSVGEFMDQMRPQLVQLAFEVAKHFISESKIDHDFLNDEISRAIDELHDHSKIEIHLNDLDYDALSNNENSIFTSPTLNKEQVIFKKSKQISRGGFTIKGDIGTRDYSRHTKLNLLTDELEVHE